MSDTIEEHLQRVIHHLSTQIKNGTNSNRANLDGYTLKGLKKKRAILQHCLTELTGV